MIKDDRHWLLIASALIAIPAFFIALGVKTCDDNEKENLKNRVCQDACDAHVVIECRKDLVVCAQHDGGVEARKIER